VLLAEEDDVELVGECSGGAEALDAIRRLRPDLLILDVQMPDIDGLNLVAQLEPEECPAIVFATANEEYALKAFEANSVDYLLKPIGIDRLRTTLNRAKVRAQQPRGKRFEASVQWLVDAPSRAGPRERLAVRVGSRYEVVRTGDILWVEAADNYVRLHSQSGSWRYRASMAEMEGMLDAARFLRIHRSIIVNVDQVKFIEPWGVGEHVLVLSDKTKLTSSRRYRQAIREVFDC
jgi:two-component system LytT family response regulator